MHRTYFAPDHSPPALSPPTHLLSSHNLPHVCPLTSPFVTLIPLHIPNPKALQSRRIISLTLLPLDLRGIISYLRGSPSPSLEILRIIPKRKTYKRALQRIYLERGSVHACILLCTRGYTVVYTRVYSSLLGRRDTLGGSTPRTRILLSSAYAPPRPCPRTMVISCVSPVGLSTSRRAYLWGRTSHVHTTGGAPLDSEGSPTPIQARESSTPSPSHNILRIRHSQRGETNIPRAQVRSR